MCALAPRCRWWRWREAGAKARPSRARPSAPRWRALRHPLPHDAHRRGSVSVGRAGDRGPHGLGVDTLWLRWLPALAAAYVDVLRRRVAVAAPLGLRAAPAARSRRGSTTRSSTSRGRRRRRLQHSAPRGRRHGRSAGCFAPAGGTFDGGGASASWVGDSVASVASSPSSACRWAGRGGGRRRGRPRERRRRLRARGRDRAARRRAGALLRRGGVRHLAGAGDPRRGGLRGTAGLAARAGREGRGRANWAGRSSRTRRSPSAWSRSSRWRSRPSRHGGSAGATATEVISTLSTKASD